MTAPAIKLILSDIDGTILPYGQTELLPEQRAVLHQALDAGFLFGPCSGRGRSWVAPIFGNDEALYATAVATNGQAVYLEGKTLREPHFAPALVEKFAAAVREVEGAGALAFVDGNPYVLAGNIRTLSDIFPSYAQYGKAISEAPVATEADPAHVWSDGSPAPDITKLNGFIGGDEARAQELAAHLRERVSELDFDVPQANFVNAMLAGQNKATGIDLLCRELGISLDEVLVFGDGGNDVAMLAHVPNSVAVAGAVPEAHAAARWHIGSVEDGAVFAAITELVSGKWPFER